jgi:hypothetical protein
MSDPLLPGALESFLQEPPVPAAAGPWRATVLRQTLDMLRRRRRRRRALMGVGVAAALMLAGLALYLAQHAGREKPPLSPVPLAQHRPELPAQAMRQPSATRGKTPLEEEWAAFDAQPGERARLYFHTGDRYLNECQDLESAVRCYQQALRLCGAEELAFNPNDNWLVMALKQDQRKER